MDSIFNYQTSYFRYKYNIFSNNLEIGNVFKAEWLGSTIEANINATKYIFSKTGFFNPTIIVIEKNKEKNIGTVKINSFFRFHPSAKLTLDSGEEFLWQSKRLFKYNWDWINISTTQQPPSKKVG